MKEIIMNENHTAKKANHDADPIEVYLKDEYGIDNIMHYEFDDLKNKDHQDFVLTNVRGNVQLMQGIFRTYKESQAIFERVFKLDFKSLLKLKP